MKKIKLAIIDDDYLIVTLLKSFFNEETATKVVYATTDGYQFFDYLEQENEEAIDILLLDLKMKTIDGLEVLKHVKVKRPELKVIVISSHYQDQSIGFMTKEGVAGFLPKGMSPFELLDIIKQVRSEEHTSELQSRPHLVCRLLLEKKNEYIHDYKYIIADSLFL